MSELQAIEELLCRCYEQQADLYGQASRITDLLLKHDKTDVPIQLEKLHEVMNATGELESEIVGARNRWHSFHQKPGPRLNKALNKAQATLEPLVTNIKAVEQRLGEVRSKMMPQLNSQAKCRSMQAAYSSATKEDA